MSTTLMMIMACAALAGVVTFGCRPVRRGRSERRPVRTVDLCVLLATAEIVRLVGTLDGSGVLIQAAAVPLAVLTGVLVGVTWRSNRRRRLAHLVVALGLVALATDTALQYGSELTGPSYAVTVHTD